MSKMYLVLILLLIVVVQAEAFTNLESNYGTPLSGLDARSAAMGHTGIAASRGTYALIYNPAALTLVNNASVDLAIDLTYIKDNYSYPIFDNFESRLANQIYSGNSSLYPAFYGGATFNFNHIDVPYSPTISIGNFPYYDYNYNYEEEIRNNDSFATGANKDALIAKNLLENDGTTKGLTFGFAAKGEFEPIKVSLGVSFALLKEAITLKREIIFENVIDNDNTYIKNEIDGSGMLINLGLLVEVGHRLNIGGVYHLSNEMERTYNASTTIGDSVISTSQDKNLSIPASFGIGIEYHPRNELLANINLEAHYIGWSELEDETYPDTLQPDLDDCWEYRIGVEHIFYNDVPFRYGFLYRPFYGDKHITTSLITIGSGFTLPYNIKMSIALAGGRRTYTQADMFADSNYGGDNRSDLDTIDETIFSSKIGISYEFK